jgi:hypothetical protein
MRVMRCPVAEKPQRAKAKTAITPRSKPVIPLELRGVIMAETPRMPRMLKILLSIMLPTAISDSFLIVAMSDILSAPIP